VGHDQRPGVRPDGPVLPKRTASRRCAEQRAALGQQWAGKDEAETDDLRLAMRQYRVFLHQLLFV
jgi:hypothetical protein